MVRQAAALAVVSITECDISLEPAFAACSSGNVKPVEHLVQCEASVLTVLHDIASDRLPSTRPPSWLSNTAKPHIRRQGLHQQFASVVPH